MATYLQGFLLMAGLIMPIGMQNAFVLNQGIRRHYHWLVASLCSLADLILMSIGVYGGALLLTGHPQLLKLLILAGALFLLYYGILCAKRAWRPQALSHQSDSPIKSRSAVVAATLTFTLLNPHVYLDTLLIIGSYAAPLEAVQRPWFIAGGITASVSWFFLLATLGATLAPWLSRVSVRRVLDAAISVLMVTLSIQLLREIV